MALTTVNITGTFNFPDATWSQYTKAEFHLSGYDTDTEVVVPQVVSTTLGAGGELDVALWGNDDGLRGTVYRVNVVSYEGSAYNKEVMRRDLGRIQIVGNGPIDIATLLDSPVSVPGNWYSTITEAEYNAAITAVTEAEAARDVAVAAADNVSSLVGPLYALASPNLPVGPIDIVGTFNNQLGASIYWDGSKVQYNISPYDLIDFTKNSDVTVNEYYVNYSTGLDTNTGMSSVDAWKTLIKVASSAVSPCIVHVEDEIIGVGSLGTSFLFDGDIKIKSAHASGVTLLTNTIESYTKATFAWVDEGDGMWSTSAAATSSTIFGRLGTMVFDRKYTDAYGGAMPCPDVGSEAACRAMPGSQWHDTANSVKYVHLYDGREPDPADGFIYSHPVGGTNFQQQAATGGTILLEGIHSYRNAKGSASANIRYRNANSTSANTSKFGAKNCLVYGGSGNNFEIYDSSVGVLQGCVSRYAHKDGLNYHSFVSTGTDGEYITIYEHDCVSLNAGYDEFADHTALGTSENCTTAHDSLHIIRTNTIAGKCVGAVFADVNGVHSLNYACAGSHPGGAWPYVFWHEEFSAAGTTRKMYLWGCAAHDDGDAGVSLVSNQPQSGGASNAGDIYIKYWRGQTNGNIIGPIKDFDGTVIT